MGCGFLLPRLWGFLGGVWGTEVVFTLELSSFEKAKDIWDMSEDEKAEYPWTQVT